MVSIQQKIQSQERSLKIEPIEKFINGVYDRENEIWSAWIHCQTNEKYNYTWRKNQFWGNAKLKNSQNKLKPGPRTATRWPAGGSWSSMTAAIAAPSRTSIPGLT